MTNLVLLIMTNVLLFNNIIHIHWGACNGKTTYQSHLSRVISFALAWLNNPQGMCRMSPICKVVYLCIFVVLLLMSYTENDYYHWYQSLSPMYCYVLEGWFGWLLCHCSQTIHNILKHFSKKNVKKWPKAPVSKNKYLDDKKTSRQVYLTVGLSILF